MDNIVVCNSLTKNFNSHNALNNVNFNIEQGKIVGLLGPNGAGKTTLIKIMAGLLVPKSGDITIGGFHPGIETKRIVSYFPDKETMPDSMTAGEAMDMFGDFFEDFDFQRAEQMLIALKIDKKKRFIEMSKGTREKVQLILAMSRNAGLYILDEPIGGVDPAAREYILDTILQCYNPKSSILISTHLVADVENILDDVILIKDGTVVKSGSVDAIREQEGKSLDGVFREVFRC